MKGPNETSSESAKSRASSHRRVAATPHDKEIVVTSGKTTGIPEGLVVGRVMEIRKNQAQNETVVEVLPLVNFDNLESVTVITGETSQDATP